MEDQDFVNQDFAWIVEANYTQREVDRIARTVLNAVLIDQVPTLIRETEIYVSAEIRDV